MLITREHFGEGNRYLLKCYHTFAKFLKSKGITKWGKVTIELVELFITRRIQRWANMRTIKPYRIELLKVHLVTILNFHTGEVSTIVKNRIKKKIHTAARGAIEDSNYQTRRAKTFQLHTVLEAMNWLTANGDWMDKAAAVIMGITFCTGARVQDTLNIRTDRIEWTTDDS